MLNIRAPFLALLLCGSLAVSAADASPEPVDWLAGPAPHHFIGRPHSNAEDIKARKVHTILTTRKSDAQYQGLVRYDKIMVPVTELPGLADLAQVLAGRGTPLPSQVFRVDQESETLVENLGLPMRSISSSRLYLHPLTGQVIAYDVANTTGGQPQRFVGHLTRSGVKVVVYRGSERVDQHELPFQLRDTFIPLEMEFIHQWYQQNGEKYRKKEPIKFSLFIPEVMGFVLLVARPIDEQFVPIGDANHDCARYEVLTVSTQAAEGIYARQEMWFDKRSGLLMRREDFETSMARGDAPVTERASAQALDRLGSLRVKAPVLAAKLPAYQVGKEYVYTLRVRDRELGRVRMRYRSAEKGEWLAESSVSISGEGALRSENAVTRFSSEWMAREYTATGTEASANASKYKVGAILHPNETLELLMDRAVEDLPMGPATPETHAADAPRADIGPLKYVPISDEEWREMLQERSAPRHMKQTLVRPLIAGTYLFDFNRIEQLAVIAGRLPLPAVPAEGQAVVPAFQKVAIFTVRQNRGGVVQFEIIPEPAPADRRRRRPAGEPQLYVAQCQSALLPCRMLLTGDGRILELALKHGSGEVTFTLDDPIMQRRADRARQDKLLEGPQVLRPPWW